MEMKKPMKSQKPILSSLAVFKTPFNFLRPRPVTATTAVPSDSTVDFDLENSATATNNIGDKASGPSPVSKDAGNDNVIVCMDLSGSMDTSIEVKALQGVWPIKGEGILEFQDSIRSLSLSSQSRS